MGFCVDCEKCGRMYDTKYFTEFCPWCYVKYDELAQKQTPPPTGREFWVTYYKPHKSIIKCTFEKPGINIDTATDEYIRVREVTDRDQKIAQAVQGLVEALKDGDQYTRSAALAAWERVNAK